MSEPARTSLERGARLLSLALLAYWGLFALLAPVMTVDAQVYNLARIELAWRDGLFGNGGFTSALQVMFPWAGDAMHLPFLLAGWGYALPSFACLAGICLVAHRLMRERHGGEAAWVVVAGLLGLTTLVYQGTSTKNDIPLVFMGAVWLHAWDRWRKTGRRRHQVWMALALGFMAGIKSTGVPIAAALGVWTWWRLGGRRGLRFAALWAAALLLFGSVETYVETWNTFGRVLGPERVTAPWKNSDPVAGTAANMVRYVAGGVYLGPSDAGKSGAALTAWSGGTRAFLRWFGLADAGMVSWQRGSKLVLHQDGREEIAGYGPVGFCVIVLMAWAVVRIRPREVWWRLAAGAWAVFFLIAALLAYNDWSQRFLLGAYVLGVCAVVDWLWTNGRPAYRGAFLVIAMVSGIMAPLMSFNRGPGSLIRCVSDRERLETSSYPLAGEVRVKLRQWKARTPDARVFFVAGDNSVVLPLLGDELVDPILIRPAVFEIILADGFARPGDLVVQDIAVGVERLERIDRATAPDVFNPGRVCSQDIYRVAAPR